MSARRDDAWNAHARSETPLRRADRNFAELLQELRVAQTGVQILFAFLLGLSFTDRFGTLDATQRGIYIATLAASALTGVLLVAPVALHRLVFQHGCKRDLVRTGHRLAIAGLCGLLATIVGGLLLVLDVVVGRSAALGGGVAMTVIVALLWVVPAWRMRLRPPADAPGPAAPGWVPTSVAPFPATGPGADALPALRGRWMVDDHGQPRLTWAVAHDDPPAWRPAR